MLKSKKALEEEGVAEGVRRPLSSWSWGTRRLEAGREGGCDGDEEADLEVSRGRRRAGMKTNAVVVWDDAIANVEANAMPFRPIQVRESVAMVEWLGVFCERRCRRLIEGVTRSNGKFDVVCSRVDPHDPRSGC